jgi:hypothetical protein
MKELALERQLYEDSYYLRNVDWIGNRNKMSDRKLQQVRSAQDNLYKKHQFLKKYRKAKEKINEKINKTIM